MEPKQYFHLETKKGEHSFSFIMEAGCPIGAAYDAAFEFLTKFSQFAQEASDKMKRPEEGSTDVSQE